MSNSSDSFKARIQIDIRFILAASLLVGGLSLLFYQHSREEEDSRWVIHTYQVIDQLKAIEALLVDAETGARGYVATGDTLFLQPYHQALPNLSTNLRTLPELVADNPAQQRRVRELNRLARAKVAVVDQIIRPTPSTSARSLLALGKQRMDAVRRQVARMIAVEQALMKERDQRLKTAYRNTTILTIVLLVLAVLSFVQGRFLIRRELNRRQEAQLNARHSNELLQTIVDNVPTGIVLYQAVRNSAGQIIDFIHTLSNPANDKVTGRAAGELLNSSMLEQYPNNRTNGLFDDLVKVIETGQPLHRLIHYEAHNIGGWFDTQYTKQDDGVLFTYLDVTALKEAELTQQQQAWALQEVNWELQRSNASLQSFAYVASHDLQEPLRKIDSFSNLLETEYSAQLDEKAADYLRRMRVAAKRMSLLIRDLLAYSKLSSSPTVFKPVSISALVTDIVDDLEIAIARSGVQITTGELPIVPGDSTQLRQLFQNLISNAIKFTQMPAGAARVAISSRSVYGAELPAAANKASAAEKVFWEISVKDNGIGFDPKYLDRIFEVFQRLHSRQSFSGSGIGLAICRRVAENHGGWITADSQPGQGATFRVYLPAGES